MTSPPDHRDHSPDDEHSGKGRLEISPVQITASALAAVSSAVAASYLGVGGTVIGAGVGSVIATVSTAVYQQSLKRTNEKLRQVVPLPTLVVRQHKQGHEQPSDPAELPDLSDTAVAHPQQGRVEPPGTQRLTPGEAGGITSVGAGGATAGTGRARGTAAVPSGTAARGTGSKASGRRSIRLATSAALVFVLAFAVITVVELFAGGSIASLVRGDRGNGTTISRVVHSTSDSNPAEKPSESPTPSTSESPSTEPTQSSSPGAGTPSASPGSPKSSEPSAGPSANAPSGEPAPAGEPDSAGG